MQHVVSWVKHCSGGFLNEIKYIYTLKQPINEFDKVLYPLTYNKPKIEE